MTKTDTVFDVIGMSPFTVKEDAKLKWTNGKNQNAHTPKIEVCSPAGQAMYIMCKGITFYIDHSIPDQPVMDYWYD